MAATALRTALFSFIVLGVGTLANAGGKGGGGGGGSDVGNHDLFSVAGVWNSLDETRSEIFISIDQDENLNAFQVELPGVFGEFSFDSGITSSQGSWIGRARYIFLCGQRSRETNVTLIFEADVQTRPSGDGKEKGNGTGVMTMVFSESPICQDRYLNVEVPSDDGLGVFSADGREISFPLKRQGFPNHQSNIH